MKKHTATSLGILLGFVAFVSTLAFLIQGPYAKLLGFCFAVMGVILLGVMVVSCLLMAKNKEDGID